MYIHTYLDTCVYMYICTFIKVNKLVILDKKVQYKFLQFKSGFVRSLRFHYYLLVPHNLM